MRSYIFFALAAAMLAIGTGCMVGGKFSKPESLAQTPDKYPQLSNTPDSITAIKWFELYQDTVLQRFIRTALDSNRNLMVAAARIEQSREIAGIVKTNLYPQFGYSANAGGGTAGDEARKIGGGVDGGSFKMYGTLNWEIDLWGKLRYNNQAAVANYLGDIEARNALVVSLVAEVAQQYFLLRDLDNRLTIAERTLAARRNGTEIITQRFLKGYTAEIDKLQSEQQEALAAALIPNLQRQIIITQNALRVLMGMGPGPVNRGDALFSQVVDPNIPAGLPSQLLERRPDIRLAERDLEVVFNRLGVAKAGLYPSLSLTGILGFASPELGTLLGAGGFVANGFGGLVGPIFEFNRNKRRISQFQYQVQEVTRQYEQTVLKAFADVDNALAQYRTYAEELEVRRAQVVAARKSLMLTEAKYNYGYSSYYEVLIQQNYLFDAELAESTTQQLKINSLVFLYKALGGGW